VDSARTVDVIWEPLIPATLAGKWPHRSAPFAILLSGNSPSA
jgi:hypothetical protein